MTKVGDKLKRRKASADYPAQATIVGQRDDKWVLQAVETFSSPFELTAIQVHDYYGGDGEPPKDVDEISSWREFTADKLADAMHNAECRAEVQASALTAEEQFARKDAAESNRNTK